MATLILTAVGTALGGPLGGSIGALLGQQVDRAVLGTGSVEGPRLRELSVTSSSYGQPIPRQFGRMRVAGTIIWSTELAETKTRSGGGKGKPSTTTYSYSASFAVALSSVPIARIGRIWADGNLLRGTGGDLKVSGVLRVYDGTGDAPVDPIIAADRGASAPAFRDCAYAVFEDLELGEFGNRIPALTFEVFATEAAIVPLSNLVAPAATVPGAETLQNARGFADEGGPVIASLAAIDRVYPLVCLTTGAGLELGASQAIPAEVPTLPPQLSPRSSESAQEKHRLRSESAEGEPVALRYYDEDRDYQPGVQRAIGMRSSGRERMIDLPAALTAEGARQLANTNAQRARWRRDRVVWRIGELDRNIAPGKFVRLPDLPGLYRVMSWEWHDRGIELELDRVSPGNPGLVVSDSGAANVPADQAVSPTILNVLEVPSDGTTAPQNPLILAAASSPSAGWRGAALYVDQGGALTSLGQNAVDRAVVGSLSADLPSSPGILFEPDAALEVVLGASDLGLSSTSISGLALGRNRAMVGGEALQFLGALHLGGGHWRLEGLLRGRAGTEDAALDGHLAGTHFVLLDENAVSLDPARVPSASATRIAAIGLGDPEPVIAPLANAGLSRRPPCPVHPRVETQADGGRRFCWTRRARGQWQWNEESEIPLVEERELYLVGFGPTSPPHAAWTTAEPQWTLSPYEIGQLVAQFGPSSIWVKQIGTYAHSRPLLLAELT